MATASAPSVVLLTGATGFLGKVVLEELIRRQHEYTLQKIILLIRPSRGITAQERFMKNVAPSACFSNLQTKWVELVDVIEADLCENECGLDPETQRQICGETTHIINCAASVAFDDPLVEAAQANIASALNLIRLAEQCRGLRGMVTTSTAYVSPHTDNVLPPAVIPLPMPAEALYARIMRNELDEVDLLRQTRYPNTYTLTKCIAEHIFLARRNTLPLTIVRPSIISCAWKYPHPGWIDSKTAIGGVVALIGTGFLKVINGKPETIFDVVPVDVVANDLIEAARLLESPLATYTEALGQEKASARPPVIVHSVAGIENGLRNSLVTSTSAAYFAAQRTTSPSKMRMYRKPCVKYLGTHNFYFLMGDILHRWLPMHAAQIGFHVCGNRKMARKTKRLANVVRKVNIIFSFYTTNTFDFVRTSRFGYTWESLEDEFTPEEYMEIICEGVAKYLLSV